MGLGQNPLGPRHRPLLHAAGGISREVGFCLRQPPLCLWPLDDLRAAEDHERRTDALLGQHNLRLQQFQLQTDRPQFRPLEKRPIVFGQQKVGKRGLGRVRLGRHGESRS